MDGGTDRLKRTETVGSRFRGNDGLGVCELAPQAFAIPLITPMLNGA
jgi:hypothetical protein